MESVLLGLIGGGLGAMLAVWGVDLLIALRPAYGPLLAATGVNGRVFAFLFVTSLLSSVAFGLVPAWQVSRLPLGNGLKEANRATVGGSRQRARKILVGGESCAGSGSLNRRRIIHSKLSAIGGGAAGLPS